MQPDYDLLVQQICQAHLAGEPVPAIAKRLSVPAQKVRYALHRQGVPLRRHSYNAVQVDAAELRRILDEAVLGIEQTAAHFGVSVPTISRRMRALGLSSKKGRGSPMEKNFFWNGGRSIDADGYILVKCPDHPHATKAGNVREHRLVMEREFGRYLRPHEVVHHLDGDKQNNAASNLQVFQSNADHLRHELTGKIPNFSEDGLRRIRENTQRVNRQRAFASRKASGIGDAA